MLLSHTTLKTDLQNVLLDLYPFKFLIGSNIQMIWQNLEQIYKHADKLDRSSTTFDYAVTAASDLGLRKYIRPQARFFCDLREPFKPMSVNKAYAMLEWGLNWVIAANEVNYVIIHSAVLARDGKAILFPAPPGSGKSTLTSFLAFNGWQLLSDEMAIIVPNSRTVLPFVRPICLKNSSIDLAKAWFPHGVFSSIAKDTHKGDVIHLSPPVQSWQLRKSSAEIVGIVFPNYDADKKLEIYQLNKLEAFQQLTDNAFNYSISGISGFNTLTKIIDNSATFEIHHNDLHEVKAFLEEDIIYSG